MKKLAGVAVSSLLVASMVLGSGVIGYGKTPMGQTDALGETDTAIPAATMPAAAPEAQSEAQPAAEDPNAYTGYLFVHFIDTEENPDKEQIYYSVSKNGTDWTTLNDGKPVLRSEVGEEGVRDPHIIRTPDNKFAIVATDLSIANRKGAWGAAQTGGSRSIIVWKGDTLTSMGEGKAYAVGTEDSLDVWAPESIWDVDKEQYMVTWASIVGDRETQTCYDWHYRIYRSYTTDFESFSEPEVYMEREGNIIDTTFYYNEANKMYYRFTKDEHNKWVFMEQGAHLDGDFEMVATYSIDGKHYSMTTGVEGPTVYKINGEEKWFLLLDNWTYKPYETEDITKGVFTTAGEFTFNGPRFRHGSVIPITTAEYDALLEAYPNPAPAEPDKTEGELIYDLDFDGGNLTATVGAQYVATASADFTFVDGQKTGKKAAEFKDNKFITLPGALLAGKDNLTLSFDIKIMGSGTSWLFFAAQNANQMNDPRTYFGTLYKEGEGVYSAERYLNQGWSDQLDAWDNTRAGADWANVTIVYYKNSTKMFINGKAATGKPMVANSFSIAEILGADPTIYLGKATWGANGEYSNMLLDRFRVYDYAMPDAQVAELYAADTAN